MKIVKIWYILLLIKCIYFKNGDSIWCYRCTSATPGCADHFNWRGIGYLGDPCPESDDICVKVTEKRGGEKTIIRDCLSALHFRKDIPADKYEGCRPAAKDVHLAQYVNHTIKEHDVRRNYFSNVTFCFCFLDHRCNDGSKSSISTVLLWNAVCAILFRTVYEWFSIM